MAQNYTKKLLKEWHVVLKTKYVLVIIGLVGLICIIIGTVLLIESKSIITCHISYPSPSKVCNGESFCTIDRLLNKENCSGLKYKDEYGQYYIKNPIGIYYKLTNYYQNHKIYVDSRNTNQLKGQIITEKNLLKSCDPVIFNAENKILSPCGLAAQAVFNDTYVLLHGNDKKTAVLHDSVEDILYPRTTEYTFKNPKLNTTEKEYIDEWLNPDIFPGKVENAHFQVWMRNAPVSTFRKLYAIIKDDLHFPIVIKITNRYDVSKFGSTKSIVLTQKSWIGNRNIGLGTLYIIFGISLILIDIYMIVKDSSNPRIMGDISYLLHNKKHL